jgi:hypothetical protein
MKHEKHEKPTALGTCHGSITAVCISKKAARSPAKARVMGRKQYQGRQLYHGRQQQEICLMFKSYSRNPDT